MAAAGHGTYDAGLFWTRTHSMTFGNAGKETEHCKHFQHIYDHCAEKYVSRT